MNKGPLLAIFSAMAFGLSPVMAKLLVREIAPPLLAGLLYLGSGMGLALLLLAGGRGQLRSLARLPPRKLLFLGGAVAAGGVLAPLFLCYGIRLASAFEVSLLLNIETVATTVIAWLVFREHVGRRVWAGLAVLACSAALLGLAPGIEPGAGTGVAAGLGGFSSAGLLVICACMLWGIDNNLTREIEDVPAVALACIKGMVAGLCSLALILAFWRSGPGNSLAVGAVAPDRVAAALALGAVSYGFSLVLFIKALREMGSARTGAYFASGPFFGMALAVILLAERPLPHQWLAAAAMIIGLWLVYREKHAHEHVHDELMHRHEHGHDSHHRHGHDGGEGLDEWIGGLAPHEHEHMHARIVHAHAHWPDTHHRHGH